MFLGLKLLCKMPVPVAEVWVEGSVHAHPPGAWTEGSLLTDALQAITEVTSILQHSLARLENLQKLTELQRDLVGIENLITPGRVSDFEKFF